MIELIRETQLPFLACVLLVASIAKAAVREDDHAGDGEAGTPHRRRSVVLSVAVTEGVLGLGLFVTDHEAVRLLTVVMFATATWVVGELARRGADEGCGCFGGLSTTPAGRRTVVRAAWLTLLAIGVAGMPQTGIDVLAGIDAPHGLVLTGEFGLLLVLSPEIRAGLDRMRQSAPCELRDVPLPETYDLLRASDVWRNYAPLITSAQPGEVWRELCTRYVVYPGKVDERPVEVVFAVPVDGTAASVRAAVLWGAAVQPTLAPDHEDDDSDTGPRCAHSGV